MSGVNGNVPVASPPSAVQPGQNSLSPSTPPQAVQISATPQDCLKERTSTTEAQVVQEVDDTLLNMTLETMDALLNTAIRAEYNVALDLVRGVGPEGPYSPLSPPRDRQLNEIERAKLQELVVANKALLAPLTEDGPVNVSFPHSQFPIQYRRFA